jgi:hypothetical protein
MTTIEEQIERLNEKVVEYVKIVIEEYDMYEVEEDDEGDTNMVQLLLGEDDFQTFYETKYLDIITDADHFDLTKRVELDFVTPELLLHMIRYNLENGEYIFDKPNIDSVECVMNEYIRWYAFTEIESKVIEELFENYYREKNEPYVLK